MQLNVGSIGENTSQEIYYFDIKQSLVFKTKIEVKAKNHE